MATYNYVQPGKVLKLIAPAGGVVKWVPKQIGTALVVVPTATVAATLEFEGMTEGVFDVPKQAALAITAGDLVYWDETADEADTTNTNLDLGICVLDAAGGDGTVRVRLTSPWSV